MEKLIITVALTGNVPTKDMNPHVPMTAEEIAQDVRRCADAGACFSTCTPGTKTGGPRWTSPGIRKMSAASRRSPLR